MIKIDSHIPAPTTYNKANALPFEQMNVGDSFFVVPSSENTLRVRASQAGRFLKYRFAVRKESNGFRVWRTE